MRRPSQWASLKKFTNGSAGRFSFNRWARKLRSNQQRRMQWPPQWAHLENPGVWLPPALFLALLKLLLGPRAESKVLWKLECVLAQQQGLMLTTFREPAHFAATIIAAQGEDPPAKQLQHLECTERMRRNSSQMPHLCVTKNGSASTTQQCKHHSSQVG